MRKIPVSRTVKCPSPLKQLGIFASTLNRYFSQITLTNRIYLYIIPPYIWMLSSDWYFLPILRVFFRFFHITVVFVLGNSKYHGTKQNPFFNSWWRRGCNSELPGFRLSTNDKVKKNVRRPVGKSFCIRFRGSNLQCWLHANILLAVKYSAELNKYVLLVRVIWEKYRLKEQFAAIIPH